MENQSFGSLVRKYRLAAGLTQQQLADRLGVKIARVSNVEHDYRDMPSWDTVQRIADALGVSTEDLRCEKSRKSG